MSPLLVVFALLLTLHIPPCCATTDTISAGQALAGNDKLVSGNDKFTLGLFQTRSKSSRDASNWYLGIWFTQAPSPPVWVANGDKPVTSTISPAVMISGDGNLVILDQVTKFIIWSTQANITTNHTTVMLLSNGNLVLQSTSNSSDVFWQSFDYPTDTHLAGAKLGWNKVTGLNRRLVSRKNSMDPASGMYSYELHDTNGTARFILAAVNYSIPYWSSGEWNGHFFGSIPEMTGRRLIDFTFVNNEEEEYFTYTLLDNTTIMRFTLNFSGQSMIYMWVESAQAWSPTYINPKQQCDVYGICGAFAICQEDSQTYSSCNCFKGFSIQSPGDWELDDWTGGWTKLHKRNNHHKILQEMHRTRQVTLDRR